MTSPREAPFEGRHGGEGAIVWREIGEWLWKVTGPTGVAILNSASPPTLAQALEALPQATPEPTAEPVSEYEAVPGSTGTTTTTSGFQDPPEDEPRAVPV